MNAQRLKVFRTAIEGLIESLEAVVRIARWDGDDAPPEPLVASAAKLVERLGVADRLSTAKFHGPAADVNVVTAMCKAMKRLDEAFRAYRQQTELSQDRVAEAIAQLEIELGAVNAGAGAWR